MLTAERVVFDHDDGRDFDTREGRMHEMPVAVSVPGTTETVMASMHTARIQRSVPWKDTLDEMNAAWSTTDAAGAASTPGHGRRSTLAPSDAPCREYRLCKGCYIYLCLASGCMFTGISTFASNWVPGCTKKDPRLRILHIFQPGETFTTRKLYLDSETRPMASRL